MSKNKQNKEVELNQKCLVNKEEKPKYTVHDTIEKDGKIIIVGEQKESAGAAPTKSLTKHLEEEHGAVSQRGYTNNQGDWCVIEIITDGVGRHFEIPEEAKAWEKKFAYVKFANDTIIVNEKEEK